MKQKTKYFTLLSSQLQSVYQRSTDEEKALIKRLFPDFDYQAPIFQVGDIVRYEGDDIGVVKVVGDDDTHGVEFIDERDYRHSLQEGHRYLAKKGHGWWCPRASLELLLRPKKEDE